MRPISQDSILDAMQKAIAADRGQGTEVPAVTVRQLVEAAGRTKDLVRDWLRRGIAAGSVEVVRVKRQALDGRYSTVSAYRLVKPLPQSATRAKQA